MGIDLKRIRHVVLDLDGTIYLGGRLFSWTLPFFETLDGLKIGYTFLTNNSSLSRQDYVESLRRKGLNAGIHNVHTSGQATIDFLRRHRPELQRLLLLGTDRLAAEFIEAGFALCDPEASPEPDAVIVGFDQSLKFELLCKAAYWIERGKPFLATHPDFVCPTDRQTVLIDCGSVCACLTAATGRKPEAVIGKPSGRMLEGLMHGARIQPHEIAVVGDRLYTDIALARETGAVGVLVLSGETTAELARQSSIRPDYILRDLGEFRGDAAPSIWLRIGEEKSVAFRSAKERCFRGAKGDIPTVIDPSGLTDVMPWHCAGNAGAYTKCASTSERRNE